VIFINLLPVSLALSAAFFWVLGQVLGKLVLRYLNSTTFNSISFIALALVSTLAVAITGLLPTLDSRVFLGMASGVLGFYLPLQLYFYTLGRAPTHKVVPIANSASVWTVLFAIFLLGEAISPILPVSLALLVVGAFLLAPRGENKGNWSLAVPTALAVAAMWGLNMVIQKAALNEGMHSLTLLWIAVVTGAILFNLTALITRSWKGQHLNRCSVGLSIISGLSNNLLGFFIYIVALGMANVSALAPFTATTIPFGFLLSLLLVGEKASRNSVLGMLLVLLGVLLATL